MPSIPLIKLIADKEVGLAPDLVSLKRVVLERYEYSAHKLALLAQGNFLRIGEAEIFEPTHSAPFYQLWKHKIHVMADGLDLDELCELLDSIAERMYKDRFRAQTDSGYLIPPYGAGSSFGIEGPTAAWLFPHEEGPALIVRNMDEDISPYVSMWFAHWLYDNARITWPTSNRINNGMEVPKLLPYTGKFPPIPRNMLRGLKKKSKNGIPVKVATHS